MKKKLIDKKLKNGWTVRVFYMPAISFIALGFRRADYFFHYTNYLKAGYNKQCYQVCFFGLTLGIGKI